MCKTGVVISIGRPRSRPEAERSRTTPSCVAPRQTIPHKLKARTLERLERWPAVEIATSFGSTPELSSTTSLDKVPHDILVDTLSWLEEIE
jgi:hypothetical protein